MPEKVISFKPSLRLLDATMIVAGSMIGSGIFIVSADMARNVGSAGWLIIVWMITGFMTVTAAVSYGELSGMFPRAGGQYIFLQEAYNRMAAFLYGWSLFAVIQTATIAAVGVAFSKFSGYFFPILELKDENIIVQLGSLRLYPAQLVSILLIVFLTFINTLGIRSGKITQNIFTITKILLLVGLIILGFMFGSNREVWSANWASGWSLKGIPGTGAGILQTSVTGGAIFGAIAAAMVGGLFSSDAWNSTTFIAGEIKNPRRNIGLSMFLGTLMVTVLYVITNIMYVSVLPVNDIAFAPEDRVAVAASNAIFGNTGNYIVAIMLMISTFGCNNGLILSGARVFYTMAKDRLFFKKAGQLNKNAVPGWALWAQCVVASILCLSGKYGDLLDMVAFVVVLFYVLTIVGIFVLRRTRPEAERPYKAFGYPFLPGLYVTMGIVFCIALIIRKPVYAGWGLAITLAGIPLYYLSRARLQQDK